MPDKAKWYCSRKLVLGLAGLSVLLGEAILDAVLGVPHCESFIQATLALGLGGVGTQGAIDMLNTRTKAVSDANTEELPSSSSTTQTP